MPPAYARIADTLAHRDAIDALTALAWACSHTESVQAGIEAMRKAERALSVSAPDFRFDRTKHGVDARVAQVRAGWPCGLCE